MDSGVKKIVLWGLVVLISIGGAGVLLNYWFFAEEGKKVEEPAAINAINAVKAEEDVRRAEEEIVPVSEFVSLPSPSHAGEISVEEAIFRRRSTRSFKDETITLGEVSQLLWAAGGKTTDGVTGPTRAFPSAGGLYPFEIYLVAGNVDGLTDGIYRFGWTEHSLSLVKEGDFRHELMAAARGQRFVSEAPISIVWVGDFDRVRRFYGERGAERYISMDVGGAGQNVHLQAEALDLGTVIVGAFRDEMVQNILETELVPLYIMPVGRRG